MIIAALQKQNHKIEAKILKNALDIIYHTGLLKNEVVELKIGDVMQNGSIVSTIPPLSDSYPRDFEKAPVTISSKSQKLIDNHIYDLQTDNLSISPKSSLFPLAKINKRYDESKLWRFLSTHCIYNSYERHRIGGIHYLCWELSKNGHGNQQIIDAAHQFSRYSNIDRTEKLVEEGISKNPMEYVNAYSSCHRAADKIISFHEMRQNKVNGYLSEFQHSLDLLLDRDKKTMLNKINKGLGKANKKLVRHGKLFIIEEISEIRINPRMIKRRKRRIFK